MRRKGSLPGKICALCIPGRRFAALFECMARESCQNQLVLDTRRRYVATNWRFSRPRALWECIGAKSCHCQSVGNASGQNPAIAGCSGMHRGEILPRQGAWERIAPSRGTAARGGERLWSGCRSASTVPVPWTSRSASSLVGVTAVVDIAARRRHGMLRCRGLPPCFVRSRKVLRTCIPWELAGDISPLKKRVISTN